MLEGLYISHTNVNVVPIWYDTKMSRMPRASPTQSFIWPHSSAVYAPLLSLELGLLLFHVIVWHLSKVL